MNLNNGRRFPDEGIRISAGLEQQGTNDRIDEAWHCGGSMMQARRRPHLNHFLALEVG
jgi:hypothetical protein